MSLENGTVKLIDVRTAKSDSGSEFNANEHGKAVTSVSYNLAIPNVCIFNVLIRTCINYVLKFNT